MTVALTVTMVVVLAVAVVVASAVAVKLSTFLVVVFFYQTLLTSCLCALSHDNKAS